MLNVTSFALVKFLTHDSDLVSFCWSLFIFHQHQLLYEAFHITFSDFLPFKRVYIFTRLQFLCISNL